MDNLRDSTMPVRYSYLDKIANSRTFKLKPNNCNDLYELIIENDDKHICFTAKKKEALPTDYYQETYDLPAILKILKLTPKMCNDLNTIMKFLEQAFNKKKIQIDLDKNPKNYINLIVIVPLKTDYVRVIKMNHVIINKVGNDMKKFNDNNNKNIICPKLKYKKTITTSNDGCHGLNDIFEIFLCQKNNSYYLASPKSTTFHISIISVDEINLVTSLKGHTNNITSVKYFNNENNKNEEYLISSDLNKLVLIWDITDNFKLKHKITTEFEDKIYGNCILFNINKQNYIVTSTIHESNDEKKSGTKLYSLTDGKFQKSLKNSNKNQTYYLISWFNNKDNNNYLIQLGYGKNLINNINTNEVYAEFDTENESYHYCGVLFKNNDKEYLCHTSYDGNIYIWDLYEKKLFNSIDTNSCSLDYVIAWNTKYFIIADDMNNAFLIVDIEELKVVESIGEKHEEGVVCVKKMNHPVFGESLLTASEDNTIKLWTCA